jgi:cytochrome c551/c552
MHSIKPKHTSAADKQVTQSAATTNGKNAKTITNNRNTGIVQQAEVETVTDNNAQAAEQVKGKDKQQQHIIQAKNNGVIQRWDWPWNWGKKKEPEYPEGLQEHERGIYDFGNSVAKQENLSRRAQKYSGGTSFEHGRQQDIEESINGLYEHHAQATELGRNPTSKTVAEKIGLVSSGGSLAGSVVTRIGSAIGNNKIGDAGKITGGVGAGLGVFGSLMEAGLDTHDILTSDERGGDKAVKGLGVIGSLGNAVNAGASGVGQVGELLGASGTLTNIAGAVAAPAGIVKGGADLVTGLVGGGMAHYRSNKLQEIQEEGDSNEGIARFASENQWMKAKSNYGKAVGGGLGVLGGATLLAAGLSNPVGWGLLAGAGIVGGGMALYNLYQKHKQGKALESDEYSGALSRGGIEVPDEEMMDRNKSWTDYFKTDAMRRRDMVRGQVGKKLAENETKTGEFYNYPDDSLSRIGSRLGVRELDNERGGLVNSSKKDERAKSYADALNF